MPARFRVDLKELVDGATGLQLWKLLAYFGHHDSKGYPSEKAVIYRVDASLLGPEAHNFEHQLECLLVRHIVYYVLAGDTTQQAALGYVA